MPLKKIPLRHSISSVWLLQYFKNNWALYLYIQYTHINWYKLVQIGATWNISKLWRKICQVWNIRILIACIQKCFWTISTYVLYYVELLIWLRENQLIWMTYHCPQLGSLYLHSPLSRAARWRTEQTCNVQCTLLTLQAPNILTLILPTFPEQNVGTVLGELVVRQTLTPTRDHLPISPYCTTYSWL